MVATWQLKFGVPLIVRIYYFAAAMINYLPYILGIFNLLLGLWLFLVSFRLYKPKHKTQDDAERHERRLGKFGTLMKIFSIALILNGCYDLIKRDAGRYRFRNGNSAWTANDRELLIKNCLRDAGSTTTKYPEITRKYCECSMDNIIKAISKDQYVKSLSKPQAEQIEELLPLFQDCVNKLKSGIDSFEKQSRILNGN
jgi:hypothetical protein